MSRSFLLVGLVAAFVACGDPPEPSPPATPPTPGTERLAELYQWPPGAGATRDLNADMALCTEQVRRENPGLEAEAPSLAGVQLHMECMEELGWLASAH